METLTWLFFTMSFFGGGYIGYRITKWHYKRKINKLENSSIKK